MYVVVASTSIRHYNYLLFITIRAILLITLLLSSILLLVLRAKHHGDHVHRYLFVRRRSTLPSG